MRWLIEKDWGWVVAVSAGVSLLQVAKVWNQYGSLLSSFPSQVGPIVYASLILTLATSSVVFCWLLFKPLRAGNRLWSGLWLGGACLILLLFLYSMTSGLLLALMGEDPDAILSVSAFIDRMLFAIVISGLAPFTSTIVWAMIIGASIGWLYDRTHPPPATELPMPDEL